jgi:hypothetical protein
MNACIHAGNGWPDPTEPGVPAEALHPETRAGHAGAAGRWDATANSATAFVSDTAVGNGREKSCQLGDSTSERFTSDTARAAGVHGPEQVSRPDTSRCDSLHNAARFAAIREG